MVLRIALLSAMLLAGCSSAVVTVQGQGAIPTPAQREHALRVVAQNRGRAFQFVAARLRTGIDADFAWRQLDTLLREPSGDMFWSYPAAGFYHYLRDILPDSIRTRFREAIGRYAPYRGDTENHFLMHYTFLLLFAEEWPEMKGTEWFNGRSSSENRRDAMEFLNGWIDDVAAYGITEWDSPRYAYFYITPLLMLRDFAKDETFRRRTEGVLEMLLADYASDLLNRSYTGAHARESDATVLSPRTADVTAYADFWFSDTLGLVLPDLAYAAMSPYSPPPILGDIARDRDSSYVKIEVRRSRAKMRYSDSIHTLVHRYTWMTPDHALGSIEGGLQQPIQQHSWDVTFADQREHNTIFGLHPQASGYELGMFFPEEPELMEAGILQSKASYGSPDKWIGGSPFERIGQYRNLLVAAYDIPEGWRFPHVDIYLPKTLDTLIRDAGGWVLARMGRSFVAIRPIVREGSIEWIEEKENWRLRLNDLHARYLVETSSSREMTFERFVGHYLRTERTGGLAVSDTLIRYRGLNALMRATITPDGVHLLPAIITPEGERDGVSDRCDDCLFDGPHVRSRRGSGIVELRGTSTRRIITIPALPLREERSPP